MHELALESPTENRVTLGCFEVGGRVIALDVAHLREVVRWQPVTPLPNSPSLIEGVIDLRGAVVPVVDLGRALGGEGVTVSQQARIAVTVIDSMVVGFSVDAAVEVLQIDVDSMEDLRHLRPTRDTTQLERSSAEPMLHRSSFSRSNTCSNASIDRPCQNGRHRSERRRPSEP